MPFRSASARFVVVLSLALVASPGTSSAQTPPAPIRFDIVRFDVAGNTLLAPAAIDRLLAAYTGRDRDFGDVQRALETLEAAYGARGYNLVSVALPEQELNQGVVRFVVTQARIGKVSVEGHRFFATDNIRRSVPGLREATMPDLAAISASLKLANESPAKHATLSLQRGPGENEVDAVLKVVDEKPWRLGLTLDNSGNESTGETNVGVNLVHANVAGLDHVLGLQYATTVEAPQRVSVYGVGYRVPLYRLGDSIDLYANHSDVDSGVVFAGLFDLQVRGKGTSYGARYNRDLPRAGPIESRLVFGLDYRDYRNGVELQGIQLGNDVTLRPLSLAYLGTWKSDSADVSVLLAGVRNVPGGARGEQDDFVRLRAGARADYSLLRYAVSYGRSLPAGWQIRASVNGQATRANLVPSEQFGAGGAGSVRGFSNREIANDQGHATSIELNTPELCARVRFVTAGCRVLAFYDNARVTRNRPLPGESAQASIGSVGVGLRAALGRSVTLQLDYAYVIDGAFVQAKGDEKLHFRLSLAY